MSNNVYDNSRKLQEAVIQAFKKTSVAKLLNATGWGNSSMEKELATAAIIAISQVQNDASPVGEREPITREGLQQEIQGIMDNCKDIDYGFDGENEIATDVFHDGRAVQDIMKLLNELGLLKDLK
jgi:hypothetical protein